MPNNNQFHSVFIRTSIFLLALRLILVEIIFTASLLILRVPFYIFEISNNSFSDIFGFFTILYLLVAPIKIIIVIFVTVIWSSEFYEVRPSEIIYHRGFLFHHQKMYSLKNIQQISVKQSFWGKLFNFGTIKLYNPFFNENFYLINIQNPKKHIEVIGPMIPDLINPKFEEIQAGNIFQNRNGQ